MRCASRPEVRSAPPKVLEPVGRHVGVPDRVLDVLVPEVVLQGACHRTACPSSVRGVTAIISLRPGGWMQQSTVPRCVILSVGSTGVTSSETARVHHAHRQRGRLAARGGRAAAAQAVHHWEMQKCLMQIVCFFFA